MNSEPVTPHDAPAPGTTTEETAPARRRGSRRSSSRATPASNSDVISDVNVTAPASTDEGTSVQAPTTTRGARRSRSRAAVPATDDVAVPATDDVAAPPADSPDLVAALDTRDDVAAPVASDDMAVTAGAGAQGESDESPARARRRRRGRGGRGAAAESLEASETMAEIEPEPEPMSVQTAAELDLPAETLTGDQAEPGAAGTARRRRRRGRGGRGGTVEAGVAMDDVADTGVEAQDFGASPAHDLAEPDLAEPDSEEEAELSPTVLRRFDHRHWRDRPGRVAAAARSPVSRAPATPLPSPPSMARDTPVPFRRAERDDRYGQRQSARFTTEPALHSEPLSAPEPFPAAPPMTPPPIVMPAPAVPPARDSAPAAYPAPADGSLDERLERLLAGQTALLQQQQQTLQSLATTMATLQKSIERMSTTGIAAGMPRAGVFVDAPNVVYAAESARVNLDYGRMLDFLCRGREMVHAIVYAPVTEESGSRFEGQRFVAPFLHKGYKLVTKPLKRFPDGTAKGNFDIELAIDIVTMSQRLDVVILISGDSDFSRLVELIQSRGVRVEVVAFASNVSWELVQMSDVFIDIAEFLHEFRAT